MPWAARSIVAKNGEASVSGRIVEQMSWLEAWERQLGGACPATGRRGCLVDADRAPGTGQRDRGGQPVRPGPDHDRIDRATGPVAGAHVWGRPAFFLATASSAATTVSAPTPSTHTGDDHAMATTPRTSPRWRRRT